MLWIAWLEELTDTFLTCWRAL